MPENANVERPPINVERRSEDESPAFASPVDNRHWVFDVRIFFQLIAIFLAGLFIYGLWLGDSPLDRTEPFRALVAHQMVKGGSWLVPRLYGEVYLRKPPLIYWIQAILEKWTGRGDEFVWRLPSAIGSALLAVFVAWWSGRWFGPRALLPSGFACLALIALWDQDRGADIDALNTALAVVTTACALELLFGLNRWKIAWCIGLGISLGATLLLKGPGGLPQVIAAMIGPAILLRDWKPLRRRAISLTIGFLIGSAIFAWYVIACKIEMGRQHVLPDHSGSSEIVQKILVHTWVERVLAFTMPVSLLVFALPVSLAVPFAILIVRRLPRTDVRSIRVIALFGTLAAAMFIWALGGNANPRYEYVMLPLLAPLVGFVWSNDKIKTRMFFNSILAIGVLVCIATLVLTGKILSIFHSDTLLLTAKLIKPPPGYNNEFWWCSVLASLMSVAAIVNWAIKRNNVRREYGRSAVLILLLFAVPMAARKNLERQKKSSQNAAAQFRSIIGSATVVSAAGVVRDLPELFYYTGVNVDAYGEFGLQQMLNRRGHWVVIAQLERYPAYTIIMKDIPNGFPRGITKLKMPDARDQLYVGWYDPPIGANTQIEGSGG